LPFLYSFSSSSSSSKVNKTWKTKIGFILSFVYWIQNYLKLKKTVFSKNSA
jgi:hypothetical protein